MANKLKRILQGIGAGLVAALAPGVCPEACESEKGKDSEKMTGQYTTLELSLLTEWPEVNPRRKSLQSSPFGPLGHQLHTTRLSRLHHCLCRQQFGFGIYRMTVHP